MKAAASTWSGGPAARRGRRPGTPARRGLVAALAVTQTVGYGVLYYAFAVVLRPISEDLGVSVTAVTGALTAAVLVTAAAAIPVGRWLDRRGGHGLMTAGSILGAVALVAWSQVVTVSQLYAVFVAIGVASAMVLYQPAFAILVAVLDPARRANALLAVTLVAGFASSVFFPLTGVLVDRHGWRGAVLTLAVTYAATAIPLHALALRHTGPSGADDAPRSRRSGAGAGLAFRDPGFWLLTMGFVLQGAAVATIGVHLVSYLVTLGHPPALAATVAGLLGVLSVTGRVLYTGLARQLPLTVVTAVVFALQAAAIGALPLVGRSTTGAIGCVAGFGLGFGVATIARATILAERYGSHRYATVAGALATPATVAKAAAPLGAAALAAAAGYTTVTVAAAVACLAAAGLLVVLRPVGNVAP